MKEPAAGSVCEQRSHTGRTLPTSSCARELFIAGMFKFQRYRKKGARARGRRQENLRMCSARRFMQNHRLTDCVYTPFVISWHFAWAPLNVGYLSTHTRSERERHSAAAAISISAYLMGLCARCRPSRNINWDGRRVTELASWQKAPVRPPVHFCLNKLKTVEHKVLHLHLLQLQGASVITLYTSLTLDLVLVFWSQWNDKAKTAGYNQEALDSEKSLWSVFLRVAKNRLSLGSQMFGYVVGFCLLNQFAWRLNCKSILLVTCF